MNIAATSFWLWLFFVIVWAALRWPAMRRARRTATSRDRRDPVDIALLLLCVAGLFVVPLLWKSGLFLPGGDRSQNLIALAIGTVSGLAFLWLFRRSHKDLGRNWSVSLEIRENHELVTRGVYRHIRHPMYASFFLWGIMQALLIANWPAGLAGLASVGLLYGIRIGKEEAMMRETFGADYDAYAARTARLIPGIF